MSQAAHLLTIQFLLWLSERPRSYAEVMDAWRTSCPRLSIWEDATIGGLVHFADNGKTVVLTAKGRAMLEDAQCAEAPVVRN